MPTFNYKARSQDGKLQSGTIEAVSETTAATIIREHGLVLTSISQAGASQDFKKYLPFLNRVTAKDKVIFARQLSTMINAGLPIVQALRIISEQTSKKYFKEVLEKVTAEIEGGNSLSASLNKYPKIFSSIFVNLVHSGEASGKLEDVLNRLATQIEKDYTITKEIKSAMYYPGFIMSAMVVVGVLMMIFVIPQLQSLFTESNAELPLPTKILIGTSTFLQHYWWLTIIGAVALVFTFNYFKSTPKGKDLWDHTKLKIPVLGMISKKIYVARFTRTLATLISGGLPILDALKIVADAVGNNVYKEFILDVAKQVENGVSLAAPLRQGKVFPSMIGQMVMVGEQTGKVDETLFKLSEFYDQEVETLVKGLASLIEPMLIVVMGVGVGGVVAAIIMPIYNLTQTF